MNRADALDKILLSYRRYYDIKKEGVKPPFIAEAAFASHNEQYYLVKAAKVADVDSYEYVYIASEERLTLSKLMELDKASWEDGMSKVVPGWGHRNTDVTLIVVADRIDQDAYFAVKKLRHYKSYCFSLKGFSNFRVVAIELSFARIAYNRQGQSLKKLFGNKFFN